MITKKDVIGKLEVLEDGRIMVRTDTVIQEDGVELTRTFHRHILEPGDDVSSRDARSQAIATALWDAKTIADYRAAKAATLAASMRGVK